MKDVTPEISIREQRRQLAKLSQLVAERIQAESTTRASNLAREAALNEQFSAERQRLSTAQRAERDECQGRYAAALTRVARDYEALVAKASGAHDRAFRETTLAAQQAIAQAGSAGEEARERLAAELKDGVQELKRNLHEFREKIAERRDELRQLEGDALRVLKKRYCGRVAREASSIEGKCDTADPIRSYATSLDAARLALDRLAGQALPKILFTCLVLMIPVLVVTLGMLAAGIFLTPSTRGVVTTTPPGEANSYLLFAAGGAVVLGLIAMLLVILRPVIVASTRTAWRVCSQHVTDADAGLDAAVKLRSAELEGRKIVLKQQRQDKLKQLELRERERLEAISAEREDRLREAETTLQQARQTAAETRDVNQATMNAEFQQHSQQLAARHESQLAEIQQREQQERAASREKYQRAWNRLVLQWQTGLREVAAAVDAMNVYCEKRFPDWNTTDWQRWQPPDDALPAVKFGSTSFRLDAIEGGLADHEELRSERDAFFFPAVMAFAEHSALLLEAWDAGRAAASRAMQNVMLRLLTALPPGKVRLTIIDAAGLGQNFSAFMHLADFDEKLVTHRIWTEPGHINQRLTNLTERMEDIIQTYLRNEFRTLDEYNRQAGEVAEPYQVLVVANFPAGFTDESAARLMSIIHSGGRCGVYTLVSTDSKLDWPRNFDLADLEAHATTIQWNGRRFCWRDDVLKDLPLVLDDPPDDEHLTGIIRVVGQKAKNAIRVEVPFPTVTPRADQWWSQDSRASIDVALGRSGASKLQYLRLGKGTSQHVLISGKTGSGKSTLLHALITNTALHYGPDEVEFYLIDFKKGVEFKPYAAHRLPHARVVAIESEREFGMSVLERLDRELRVRGDLFREAGVQDIKSYRDANPERHLPRVLLVIDEFQEFFTHDDKLAQEAGLLLDRLVRQGRAFGIHVLLGSQTLAGAYSLARSTLGQMAVRIALQCSEADSHLILSEDNTAARLLSRPGEAIYNDANGLFEGNHPFQVVWLAAGEQEHYLAQLAERARAWQAERQRDELPELIVFEGNAPADPAGNALLRRLLTTDEPTAIPLAPVAWLGAAVAIKDPTAAVFRRQSGANLLVVGQQEEMALAILANAILSLSAAFPAADGGGARVQVFDGTRSDAPEAGWWRRFSEQLPWQIAVTPPSDAARQLADIAAEVARRVGSGETELPLFVLLHNLGRFRELRRSDDDYGLSGLDDQPSVNPSKLLATILREGPAVGVHGLVWCDTLNTVNRWLDRATLREFDQRVLMQLSANDSSNLMDSPAASRLGQHRALLYSEELGQYEKFRPYGVPPPDWLNWIRQQVAARSTPNLADQP